MTWISLREKRRELQGPPRDAHRHVLELEVHHFRG